MNTAGLEARSAHPAELSIRQARTGDHDLILALLQSLDLGYPGMDLSCFWVAELKGALVATAELKEGDGWSLLSCVGVREELQGRGIGRALVERVAGQARSPVYLYTLIPEFFKMTGFLEANSPPADLPPRTVYGCSGCSPLFCRCLVRPRNAS